MDSIILPFFVTNNHVIARNEAIAYFTERPYTVRDCRAIARNDNFVINYHYL
jgi:hypothetical protein